MGSSAVKGLRTLVQQTIPTFKQRNGGFALYLDDDFEQLFLDASKISETTQTIQLALAVNRSQVQTYGYLNKLSPEQ